MSSQLNRKEEINAEIIMLNSVVTAIEEKIAIYSAIDMVHTSELIEQLNQLNPLFLDLLNESNALWLQSIKDAA